MNEHSDRDHSERPCSCPPLGYSSTCSTHGAFLCAPAPLADAGTPQSAPEPSQAATEAHGGDCERCYWKGRAVAAEDALGTLRHDLAYAEQRARDIEDRAEAKVGWWEESFPCDGLCSDAPEEDCSRHGRKPAELWAMLSDLNAKVTRLTEQLQHECPHHEMSWTGADQTDLNDDAKVWVCDNCGKTGTRAALGGGR